MRINTASLKWHVLIPVLALGFALQTAAQDSIAIFRSLTTDKQKADTLIALARKMRGRGKADSAQFYMNMAAPYAKHSGDFYTLGNYYAFSGNGLVQSTRYKEAVTELRKGLYYGNAANDYSILHHCYYLLLRSFTELEMYDSAHYYFEKGEALNQKYNPYRNWSFYALKGRLYMTTGNFSMGEKYFLQAYQLTKTGGVRMDHGVVLADLSEFYRYASMPEKYAGIMQETMDFYSAGRKKNTSNSLHDMFFTAGIEKMPPKERIDFLMNVKSSLLKSHDTINAAYANSLISKTYENNNQPQLSVPYMKENAEWTKQGGHLLNHFIYSKALFRLLVKTNQFAEAFKISDYLFTLKDSMSAMQQQEKILELETKYQTEKKQQEIELLTSRDQLSQKEIALLQSKNDLNALQLLRETEQRKALFRENMLKELAIEKGQHANAILYSRNMLMDSVVKSEKAYNELLLSENKLKNSELQKEAALKAALDRENDLKAFQLRRERTAKWILAGGSLLLLLSGLLAFVFYRKQKRKNSLIEKQSHELEVLMKEIHHRVKNNLQIVSSLLDLQSLSITDAQASEAVKEGKNRVQSMALIHQNLYSEGNIKGIKVKEYVSNLLQSLCDSYNISNDKVNIRADIGNLNLDVDTMIPLGLVLNELVSNAFKYAFRESRQGILSILLEERADQLHLRVADNGVGFPEGLDVKAGKSFGLKMIRAFAQKLKAKLDIYNNNGAVVEMQISKFKMA